MADFDPVGLAIDWLDTCKRNDWENLPALYAINVTATVPSDNAASHGHVLSGRTEIANYWKATFQKRQGALFELVELYPGVDSAILIYYDEQCRRISEFLQFDAQGLIVASARHAIPRRRQEPSLLGEADITASPLRQVMLHCEARQTFHEARQLPIGPTRNNLRQRAVALLQLSKRACLRQERDIALG